jgi:hypothetical protein
MFLADCQPNWKYREDCAVGGYAIYCRMSVYPKSPKEMSGRMMYFFRMLDRIRRPGFGVAFCLCVLVLAACQYEAPITSSPTRKVQEQLLGNWISNDGKENMRVRQLDDSTYVVDYDGDLFRAYHSDLAETPFASVQDLNSNDRKYAYVIWKLSDDGKRLTLGSINNKIIPKETKDSAAVAALLIKNARNPGLFGEEIEFRKEK